jgi:hypothetical protein
MVMSDELARIQPRQINPKFRQVEMLFDTDIKNRLDSIPEPFHTYYLKVKKWNAQYPEADINQFKLPTGIMNSINTVKQKMMQLKIGGLREEFGFSAGSKFKLDIVIQSIASGRGLTSRTRPFIRVTSEILHSITLLLDFSSSMKPYHQKIRESVYIISEVLNRLRLPFAIFGYSEKFWIIKNFADKWNIETKARLFTLKPAGMSPAGIAIDVAGNITRRSAEKGKIMFVITDGLFDDRIQAKLAVKSARKAGVVTVGISTSLDIHDVFPINILETENLNEVWSQDSFMRLYSKQFHSDY